VSIAAAPLWQLVFGFSMVDSFRGETGTSFGWIQKKIIGRLWQADLCKLQRSSCASTSQANEGINNDKFVSSL
jgi:hypothetical protein